MIISSVIIQLYSINQTLEKILFRIFLYLEF